MAKAKFPMNTISISSYFGERTYTLNGKKVKDFHYGWDMTGSDGQKGGDLICLPDNGYFIYAGSDENAGNFVLSEHYGIDNVPKNKKVIFYYGHLYSISTYVKDYIKNKTPVKQGLILGKEGRSGKLCTGNHLHLGVFLVDKNYKFTTVTALRKYAVDPSTICYAYPDQTIKHDPKKLVKKA